MKKDKLARVVEELKIWKQVFLNSYRDTPYYKTKQLYTMEELDKKRITLINDILLEISKIDGKINTHLINGGDEQND